MGYIVRMQLPLVQVPEAGAAWAYPGTADFALADAWLERAHSGRWPGRRPRPRIPRRVRTGDAPGPPDLVVRPGPRAGRRGASPETAVLPRRQGRELLDLPRAPRPAEDEEAPVRFLPEFDNLLLAYADRTRIVADAHRKAMTTKNLMQPAVLLVDGTVAATWTVERTRGAAVLTVAEFAKLTRPVRAAIEAEGARLIEFVEPDAASATVRFVASPVTSRGTLPPVLP